MTHAAAIDTQSGPTITPRDRLGFGIFLALALHAALILGIGLDAILPQPEPKLTVSLYASTEPTKEPAREKPLDNQLVEEAVASPKIPTSEPLPANPKSVIAAPKKRFNRDQLIGAIAHFENTKSTGFNSRVRRLEEPNASKQTLEAEAAYLAMWRRKCERIGRVNYPPGNIQGELVMRVSILSSGQLESVRIIRSSGSSLLDNAALETVKQASPYQPFSIEMRKAYDRLEFTRTWQYSKFGADINR